jgi:hypothetical protein
MKNKTNMKKARKQNKNKGNKIPGLKDVFNSDVGDIPRPIKRTYSTASCKLPRLSSEYCTRVTARTGIAANVAAGSNVFNFTLAGSGAASVWDQYRIDAIRFSITPENNAVGLVTNSTTNLVDLHCVIDYDDSTALTSAAAALGYSNCMVLSPGESGERVFQPRAALAAYAGAFTNFGNVGGMWIDSASSGVQHYGVKFWRPGGTAGQTTFQTWDITVEYFISFKSYL